MHLVEQDAVDLREDVLLALGAGGAVDVVEAVLLQVGGVEVFALEVGDEVVHGRAFLADDLHHLVDFAALAEDAAGAGHLLLVDHALVAAPGVERVDGRVAAGVGAFAVEAVEGADDLQRRLRHRLVEVAAGGGDGAADGDRPGAAVAQADDAAALVEGGDGRFRL